MTPTSIQDKGFETPNRKALSREDLVEIVDKLITAYLDSLWLLKARSMESEDAANVATKLNSYLFSNNIRELSEGDIKVIAGDVKSSVTLSWFFTRMLSSVRATSIDNSVIDAHIYSALTFFPLSKMDNEYSAENSIATESAFRAIYDNYQFMKILALIEILNISQEIEYRKIEGEPSNDR